MHRTVRVRFDDSVREAPASGRLVLYLTPVSSPIDDDALAGFDVAGDRPVFAIDVADLQPGEDGVIDENSRSFPVSLVQLDSGRYRARAVLDLARTSSDWRNEPGNLYSNVVPIELHKADSVHVIRLTHVVEARPWARREDVHLVEMGSPLLSSFRASPVTHTAGVVLPRDYDPSRAYPAIYVIPPFAHDHFDALEWARRWSHAPPGTEEAALAGSAFVIVLDPEGPFGHHHFADSANNGPVATALVDELVPALEARFNLISDPEARLLTGHGAGGWSAVWLALTEPDTFGAAWATAPDPVDFRALGDLDIYSEPNAYLRETIEIDPITCEILDYEAEPVPAKRIDGRVVRELRHESRTEQVIGPSHTSAGPWDARLAAFAPRTVQGPADLWNPRNGYIDRSIASAFAEYDVTRRVQGDPAGAGRIVRERIRIMVGSADEFYLDQAATLLAATVADLPAGEGEQGFIEIVPGEDHESIRVLGAPRFTREVLDYLRRHRYAQ